MSVQLYLKGSPKELYKMHHLIHTQPGKGDGQCTANTLGKHLHLALENPKTNTGLTFSAGQNLGDERTERNLQG